MSPLPDERAHETQFVKQLEGFIEESWQKDSDTSGWFRALHKRGWLGVDWPVAHGGTGWTKRQQWLWLKVTGAHLCPLPDDTFTVIAPLIIGAGSSTQKQQYLPDILAGTANWALSLSAGNQVKAESTATGWNLNGYCNNPADASLLCLVVTETGLPPARGSHILVLEKSDLQRLRDSGNRFDDFQVDTSALLGIRGKGFENLIEHQSTLLTLMGLNQSICYIDRIQAKADNRDNRLESGLALTELKVDADAMQAMFLLGVNHRYINLRASIIRTTATDLLLDALGYYALLTPDPLLTDNEPDLPFEAERQHLAYLNRQLERDIMLQKNMLYEEIAQGMEA